MNNKNPSHSDILSQIVSRRCEDIARLGVTFGFDVPEQRMRPVRPFMAKKGVILEVKRASPSKGDIAPDLDAAATARAYAQAGAAAISCLTETNYFKGTLGDLMNVCAAVDAFAAETALEAPAVLRKDFLVSAEEVEVAYRAGADAVLLIARILEKDVMLEMAQTAERLGISALIEVRKDEDLEKLAFVMEKVSHNHIVCGVNSRDLRDFSIDLLIPAGMLAKIRRIAPDARVTFESGILSAQAAARAAAMGFNALLLGEAAAKNPVAATEFTAAFTQTEPDKNGGFWTKYAQNLFSRKDLRPLVKICGLTNADDALCAAQNGADFLGFILWRGSKRRTDEACVRKIRAELEPELNGRLPKFIGVIVESDSPEAQGAIRLAEDGILDAIQLHGFEVALAFAKNSELAKIPHYCAVNIRTKDDLAKLDELNRLGEPRILVDAQTDGAIGGTGTQIGAELVQEIRKKHRLWLAGGITPENVSQITKEFSPELLDIASGVESEPGKKKHEKIRRLFGNLAKTE